MHTLNRYGNPILNQFDNIGYLSVDRDTRDGRFVSQIKRNEDRPSVAWFKRVFFNK